MLNQNLFNVLCSDKEDRLPMAILNELVHINEKQQIYG